MQLHGSKATFVFAIVDGKPLDHSLYNITSSPADKGWSAGNTPEDVEIDGVKIPEGTMAYCFEAGAGDVSVSMVDPPEGAVLVTHVFN